MTDLLNLSLELEVVRHLLFQKIVCSLSLFRKRVLVFLRVPPLDDVKCLRAVETMGFNIESGRSEKCMGSTRGCESAVHATFQTLKEHA
jgi:hypothetical protein